MKSIAIVVCGVGILLIAALVVKSCLATEEGRIRGQLDQLAELATFSDGQSQLAMVGRARRVGDLFSEDCEVSVQGTRGLAAGLQGRKAVTQAMLSAQSQLGSLDVRIFDPTIRLNQEQNAAIVEARVQVATDREGYSGVEAVRFDLLLTEDGWLFVRVIGGS